MNADFESYVEAGIILKEIRQKVIDAVTNESLQRVFTTAERSKLTAALRHIDSLIDIGDVRLFRKCVSDIRKTDEELKHVFY